MAFTQLITVCIDISLDKQRPNNSLYSLFCRSPRLSGRGPVTVDFYTALFKQSTKRSRALQGRLDILNPVSKEHWCASVHAHRHARQCSNPTLSFLFKIKCQITSRQCKMLFVCRWSLIFTGNDCLSLIITCSRECVSGLFCHLAFLVARSRAALIRHIPITDVCAIVICCCGWILIPRLQMTQSHFHPPCVGWCKQKLK